MNDEQQILTTVIKILRKLDDIEARLESVEQEVLRVKREQRSRA